MKPFCPAGEPWQPELLQPFVVKIDINSPANWTCMVESPRERTSIGSEAVKPLQSAETTAWPGPRATTRADSTAATASSEDDQEQA